MFETIRNAAKIGLGAISLSHESLRALIDEMTELGKISREEGERLYAELEKASDEYRARLSEKMDEAVNKALDATRLAKRAEVDTLKRQLADLQTRVAAKKAAKKPAKKPAAKKKAKKKK
ncbi:MAG: hypothetical protein HY804_02060 [Nitrospinae bacterium]|nr:hypothetical protein [Nitrospinota bacterium]